MAFDIYVYQDGERIGVVENFESAVWSEAFYGAGEIEITALVNEPNIEQLAIGNVLWKTDSNTAAIIESVETDTASDESRIIVRGRTIEALLARRAVIYSFPIHAAENDTRNLIYANLRSLPNVTIQQSKGIPVVVEYNPTGENLLDAALEVMEIAHLGLRGNFDPLTGHTSLEIYEGIDRSWGTDLYRGYLGDDIGNLSNTNWFRSHVDYVNYAYIMGADNRVFFLNGHIPQEERRELVLDYTDEELVTSFQADTGEIDAEGNPIMETVEIVLTEEQYKAKLLAMAQQELDENRAKEEIDVEMVESEILKAGIDYGLGDLIPCKVTSLGLSFNTRVISITDTIDAGSFNRLVTLRYEGVITLG